MRLVACALILVGGSACSRRDGDPPPRAAGSGTVADAKLPVWFGDPHRTTRIAGRVIGAPATVHLRIAAPDATVWTGRDVATQDGRFDFGEQRAGRYAVIATSPGHTSRVVETDGTDEVAVFTYPCTPVERTVRVAQRPLEGAAIDVAGVAVATTDRAGRFTVCVGPDPLVANVRAAGFGAATTDLRGDVELVAATTIEGDVSDAKQRIAGVAIQPVSVPVQAVADEDGRFTLRGVPARGRFAFRVFDGTRDLVDPTTQFVAGAEDVAHVSIAYARTERATVLPATLTGRIVHAGAPLGDAEVRIGDRATRSRLDGTFALPWSAAAGTLRVTHPTGLAMARDLAAGADDVTIELLPVVAVSGRVDGGGPVHLVAHDSATTYTATPGPTGRFVFPAVEQGTIYRVEVDGRGVVGALPIALGQPDVTDLALHD